MGFHDKTRLNRGKMELVISLNRVNVLFHLVKKLDFYHNRIQTYAYFNFGYNHSSLNVIMEKKHFTV